MKQLVVMILFTIPVLAADAQEPTSSWMSWQKTTVSADRLVITNQALPVLELRSDPEERERIARFYAYDRETQRIMVKSYDETNGWARFGRILEELAYTAPEALEAALTRQRAILRLSDGRVLGVK